MNDIRNFIPEHFRFSHEYCFFIHDQLADIVISGEANRIFEVEYKLRDRSHMVAMEGKSSEELLDWMAENGYEEELYSLYYKQIIVALLSDTCHFIYEALKCSEKGKLTVTYALLRKPLKENLFLFEWLLADPGGFIASFISDPSQMPFIGKVCKRCKVGVIAEALSKTEMKRWINPEFIYELRYARRENFSFDQLWDKAIHPITKFKPIETETANLNFVFSGNDSRESQWEHLYSFLPISLFHTLQVISALVSNFAVPSEEAKTTSLRCSAGMILCCHKVPWQSDIDGLDRDLTDHSVSERLECPKCGAVIPLDQGNYALFYKRALVECRQCQRRFGEGARMSISTWLWNMVGCHAGRLGQRISKRS